MPSIERKLQHSLNRLGRWCDENGFKFSPTKTMCVHFCQLQKQLLDPELYLNGTQIPIIGESKVLGLISKLSFIPHITSLKSRCIKSLGPIMVVFNTTWVGGGGRLWWGGGVVIERFYYVYTEL